MRFSVKSVYTSNYYDMLITHWIISSIVDLIEKTHYYIKVVSIFFTVVLIILNNKPFIA